VKDTNTGLLYALKIIRCPFGSDSVKDAMKEVEMYRLFQHENIIKVIVRSPYFFFFFLINICEFFFRLFVLFTFAFSIV